MSQKLFNDFDEVSAKAWKQKIQYDLKGADYNKTLVWESPEGIKVKPFYNSEDIVETKEGTSFINHSWHIGQTIYVGNTIMANEKAVKAIKRGTERLQFTIPSDKIDMRILLKNINIVEIPIYLNLEFLSYA